MNDKTKPDTALEVTHPVRPADLPTSRPTQFELAPAQAVCDAIAQDLKILGLKKLRFVGDIRPLGKHDWQMSAQLGATVVQECVVTLEPVTTRIDEAVTRQWLRDFDAPSTDEEVEMPEDDTIDALTDVIDLGQVMVEALALALPLYPRVDGAEVEALQFSEPGVKPMSDDDAKPFAGLSALRDQLSDTAKKD